jgi:uncharacterized protein (TIGR00290 family)
VVESGTTVVSWSTGKDSLLALREIPDPVPLLLTTLNDEVDRTSMHGLRTELFERQVESLGLEVYTIRLPPDCSNETYENLMEEAQEDLYDEGFTEIVLGDLFLEDIRSYRENQMRGSTMEPRFPLWQRDTDKLARRFLGEGYRANVVCVDTDELPPSFAGRYYNKEFLEDLPAGVDPCGENGEFHTFVYDGPTFSTPVSFKQGQRTLRDGFAYQDLKPI